MAVGGDNAGALASCEIWDATSGNWTTASSLATARQLHTAARLPNGFVLAVGGDNLGALASAEIYDPSAGTWTSAGTMNHSRGYPSSALLPNGQVLVVGGYGSNNITTTYLATAEIYDPTTGTWNLTGWPAWGGYGFALTVLPSGRVVKMGGLHSGYRTEVEVYDFSFGGWTTVTNLAAGAYQHRAATLTTGEVLLAGGYSSSGGYSTNSFLFNEGRGFSDSWAPVASLIGGSSRWPATLPASSSVTISGVRLRGVADASGGDSRSAPGDTPVVTLEGPLGNTEQSYYGQGSHTVRALPAAFSPDGRTLTIATPASGTLAKGTYLLRVSVNGVTSVARPVRVP